MNLDDHEVRRLYAELNVLRVLVEATVTDQARLLTEDERRNRFDALLQIVSQTKCEEADDEGAELAADIAIQTQELLRTSLLRIAKWTRTNWTPPAPDDLLSGILRQS
ncbi:hypothetical protein [Aureimonas sp. Leaf324]|uniref:hypothetical protein n=1 Tax=Aureimonas sp. Leaf324 TaxID=1736336 RepID=UPI0012E14288|nr:hypothetical protein [Aureimonas sp. Leaf324]